VIREVERYSERLSQVPATEAIKQLLAEAEVTRRQEVDRMLHRLTAQPLSVEQQAMVEALTKSLTAKLLHPQLAALREVKRTEPAEE
jgi:glutamyl-tRNA reductase